MKGSKSVFGIGKVQLWKERRSQTALKDRQIESGMRSDANAKKSQNHFAKRKYDLM
jgi:hypothetical protein